MNLDKNYGASVDKAEEFLNKAYETVNVKLKNGSYSPLNGNFQDYIQDRNEIFQEYEKMELGPAKEKVLQYFKQSKQTEHESVCLK